MTIADRRWQLLFLSTIPLDCVLAFVAWQYVDHMGEAVLLGFAVLALIALRVHIWFEGDA